MEKLQLMGVSTLGGREVMEHNMVIVEVSNEDGPDSIMDTCYLDDQIRVSRTTANTPGSSASLPCQQGGPAGNRGRNLWLFDRLISGTQEKMFVVGHSLQFYNSTFIHIMTVSLA